MVNHAISAANFLVLQAELGEEWEVVAQRLVATILIVGSAPFFSLTCSNLKFG
jgi:hypothetical protein